MADLNLKIGADVGEAVTGLDKVNAEMAELQKQLATTQKYLPGFTSRIEDLKNKLAALAPQQAAAAENLKKVTAASKEAEKASGGFAKGLTKAYSGLRTLANIIPGIGIGGLVGLIAGPLIDALSSMVSGLSSAAQATKNLNDAFEGGKDGFVKATLEVSNLKIAFKQAEDGIITKGEALKLYNDTIGKTTGQVHTLDEAEQALARNAEAYIRFTLLKAASNFALKKAAESAFQAEEARIKQAQEFQSISSNASAFGAGQTSAPGFVPGANNLNAGIAARAAAAEAAKKKVIKIAEDAKNAQLSIAQKFLDDADKISQEFKFDFNGIKEPVIKVKEVKLKPFKLTVLKPEDGSKTFFDDGAVKLTVPVSAELDFKKSLRDNPFKDEGLKGILSPEALDELNMKSKLAGMGITKGIQDGLETGVDGLRFPQLKALTESATSEFKAFNEAVTDTIQSTAVDVAAGLGEALGSGGNLFEGFINILGNGLKTLGKYMISMSTIITGIKTAIKSLNPVLMLVGGVALVALGSALSNAKIPGFANGVTNFSGGLAMVGERGPEVVRLPKGSDVIPNHALGGIGQSQTNVFIPDIRLKGNDLVVVFNRASQTIGRNG